MMAYEGSEDYFDDGLDLEELDEAVVGGDGNDPYDGDEASVADDLYDDAGGLDPLGSQGEGTSDGDPVAEDTDALFGRIMMGGTGAGEARDALAEKNMGLVLHLVRLYGTRSWMSRDELVWEGRMGLLEAIDTFEPERGYKFSTHAWNKIRNRILRASESDPQVVMQRSDSAKAYLNLVESYRTEHGGRAPNSDDDLLSYADARYEQSESGTLFRRKNGRRIWTPAYLSKTRGALTQTRPALSLDAPMGSSDEEDGEGDETGADLLTYDPGDEELIASCLQARKARIRDAIRSAFLEEDVEEVLICFVDDPGRMYQRLADRYARTDIDRCLRRAFADADLIRELKEAGL